MYYFFLSFFSLGETRQLVIDRLVTRRETAEDNFKFGVVGGNRLDLAHASATR